MSISLLKMKKIASAVELGRLAAGEGRVENPFHGKSVASEELRQAFHLGWNSVAGSEKLFTEAELLDPKI